MGLCNKTGAIWVLERSGIVAVIAWRLGSVANLNPFR